MRRSTTFGITLLTLAIAGGLLLRGAGAEDDAKKAIDKIQLPRLGTIGRVPDPERAVVVDIDGQGRITVDGEGPLSLEALRETLHERTKDRASREEDGACNRILHVRADASLPFCVSQWVMQAAAHPSVMMYRIFFGARWDLGDQEGAIGWTLPKDTCGPRISGNVEKRFTLDVKLFARPGHERSKAEDLFPYVRRALLASERAGRIGFTIKTPPPYGAAVPTGFVLRVADVLLRCGAIHLAFEGAMMPPQATADATWLQDTVARIKSQHAVPFIRVGDRILTPVEATERAPAGKGRLDRLHGFGGVANAEDPTADLLLGGDVLLPMEEPDLLEPEPPSRDGAGEGAGQDPRLPPSPVRRMRSAKTQMAVDRALRWLAAHASPSGAWEAAGFAQWCDLERREAVSDGRGRPVHDVGTTGLALLAFLEAGYTPRGKHDYTQVIQRGLDALRANQDREGCFGPRSDQHFVYGHAIATTAMIQAFARTQSPRLRPSAQRGLDFIALARNPTFAWRYGVRPGDNDTSITGWMVAALHAAEKVNEDAERRGVQAPLKIDLAAYGGTRAWLGKATDPETGRVGYTTRGGPSSRPQAALDAFPGEKTEAMTALGLVLRHTIGVRAEDRTLVDKGVRLCLARLPAWRPEGGTIDLIYWTYATVALRQVGGAPWRTWKKALLEALLPHQRKGTDVCAFAGSWDPIGAWGTEGGRVYATALVARCLLLTEEDA